MSEETKTYKGALTLTYDYSKSVWEYILVYHEYPAYQPISIKLQDGDKLTIRGSDGMSIVLKVDVEFDYNLMRAMEAETGIYRQVVNGHAVAGVQKGLEPSYWLSFFIHKAPADVTRVIEQVK